MNQSIKRLICSTFALAFLISGTIIFAQDVALTPQTGRIISGRWFMGTSPVSIGGKLFDSSAIIPKDYLSPGSSATFNISGYNGFTGFVGISDRSNTGLVYMTISVDGELVKEIQLGVGNPIPLEIPLAGHKTIKFEILSGEVESVVFGDPKLVKRTLSVRTSQYEELSLGATPKVVAGSCNYGTNGTVSGKVFPNFLFLTSFSNRQFVTFDVRRWDNFKAEIGMSDRSEYKFDNLTIEVDGQEVKQFPIVYGSKSFSIVIPVKGHQTLTLVTKGTAALIGNARLSRGTDPNSNANLTFSSEEIGNSDLNNQSSQSDYVEIPVNSTLKVLAGRLKGEVKSITAGGKPFDDWIIIDWGDFGTLDARGWDGLIAEIAIRDHNDQNRSRECVLTIEIDGQRWKQFPLKLGSRPQNVEVPLTGHDSITFRSPCGGYATQLIIGNAKFYRGKKVNSITSSTSSNNSGNLTGTNSVNTAGKKPITNADVVKMVKAGLSENTIILAIQKGSPQFDLLPDSLISLKEQGVSQKIMDTMLNAQEQGNSPANVSSTNSSSNSNIPNEDGVFIKNSSGFTKLDQIAPSTTRNEDGSVGKVIQSLKSNKVFRVYAGESSQTQFSEKQPSLYISGSESLSKNIFILRLRKNNGTREVEYARTNLLGKFSEGYSDKDLIRVSINQIGDNIIQIIPSSDLPVGEYLLILNSKDISGIGYSFAISPR